LEDENREGIEPGRKTIVPTRISPSSTGFSLCSFDFSLPQIKTTQAEACATKTATNRLFPQPE
jgi:hypothetical protein